MTPSKFPDPPPLTPFVTVALSHILSVLSSAFGYPLPMGMSYVDDPLQWRRLNGLSRVWTQLELEEGWLHSTGTLHILECLFWEEGLVGSNHYRLDSSLIVSKV